jgi:hypothetical protein
MTEWQQTEEVHKAASDIVASLFAQVGEINMRYAVDEIQHDEWAAEMRLIDQKLGIFGLRLDHPERFAGKVSNRL